MVVGNVSLTVYTQNFAVRINYRNTVKKAVFVTLVKADRNNNFKFFRKFCKMFYSIVFKGRLSKIVVVISQAKRNLFPVVDVNGELLGIVVLDDIRNIMFRQELYHRFKVEKFMISPPARINVTDSMEEVMKKFDDTKAWNLPVINEEGKYKGFVSKSKIFNSYRQVLVDFSED